MRKLAVAMFLAIAPLATAPLAALPAIAATISELGDLGALSAIAADTLVIAKTGDLKAAEKRVTDFESAWDQAAGSMQPLSPEKWHAVDMAADRAIEGLRAGAPVQADVEAALAGLIAELDNPGAGAAATPVAAAAPAGTFAVTNADGSPLPCEVALKTVRDAAGSMKPTDQGAYDGAMNKGLERCNADDDKRADGFFAAAYALLQ